ncbi:midasin [Tothia fuscella]|uniref:Midasin n=1 Tax=Tothia fuscella TaxID=1048955 RepID=A0A9P4TV02_9PEZI|nr:midasin [Tothia fuscella]
MPSILALAIGAASVLCHLRDALCRAIIAFRHWNWYEDLATRAQQRIVPLDDSDIAVISKGSISNFVAAIAEVALDPRYTDTLFANLEPLFAEICARWTSSIDIKRIIPAFGRIIPFAPHLAEYAEAFLAKSHIAGGGLLDSNSSSTRDFWTSHTEDEILQILLGSFRLLVVNSGTFAKKFNLSTIKNGLTHTSRPVRFLTIRILCVYLHAADAAMEKMITNYLGVEAVYGVWEGKSIDFRFLSLWEEKRSKDMLKQLKEVRQSVKTVVTKSTQTRILRQSDLSPMTAELCGVLVPRLGGVSAKSVSNSLVPTSTTTTNVQPFAKAILGTRPVLLTGLAGAGKSSIVNHCAQQLNKLESMVTLHLNEQSDAKLLIGMYTSGSTPGTFTWRPGALTTAVREGRWVFIEDLDRAPNEIISTLLPLIERGELLIPSRGKTVRAAHGFRIIATMRTHLDMRGNESLPRQHMVGSRFWKRITVKMMVEEELSQIIVVTHPKLQSHVPQIINVYSNLKRLSHGATSSSAIRTAPARQLSPRDLFKWCARLDAVFPGPNEFSESLLDSMFLEAVDCFVGYLPAGEVFQSLVACIAQELHIDALRRDHLLQARELRLTIAGSHLTIGRSTNRISKQRKVHRQRFFANSPHTLRLLERLSIAISNQEPLLLVGETGIGKTTCIQQLADQLGRKLISFNLSQQSESGDLLGGFKPVNVRGLIMPLKDEFDELFNHELSPFAKKKDYNRKFESMLNKACGKGQWRKVCMLWKSAMGEVEKTFQTNGSRSPLRKSDGHHPRKKQRVDANGTNGTNGTTGGPIFYQARWTKFAADVKDLDSQLASKSDAIAFKFVEGSIVKAVRNGDWVLLDEINLATPDTLEALVDLLGGGQNSVPSLLLTETGNLERITAHPSFRVFAAMNPATDVGKKDLPVGIRSRFTELYVDSPDRDMKSLLSIVQSYLPDELGRHLISDVTNLYCEIQALSDANSLIDGAGQKPHFSLRTLTRTLTYARDIAAPVGAKDGVYRRALYEGFHMSFLTLLDTASENLLAPKILHHLFSKHSNAKSELSKHLPKPDDGRTYVQEGHYWLCKGDRETESQPHYIITPFVRRNLDNLIRAVSTKKLPILIQGPTSSGKTSMIEYLAKKSGHKFVRINNHEHTDLQEYLGTYVSGSDGRLHFQEGILVEALRNGHWIVLDELNLAPSDVLEALNRLLDDNRELLIPDTQEVVRPHPDFMLFATQNPAGLYGGRKHLSRAFRNRFLELHFGDIPVEELTDILYQRTQIPPSWSRRIVDSYKELSIHRQENRMFEQKSFATLRDLFRWAQRKADTIEELADNGFMLLAERVRKPEEREKVKSVIEEVLSRNGPRVRINEALLYSDATSPDIAIYKSKKNIHGVVWTKSMKRLFILVAHALKNNEPILLVGETGSGKTTVCQMFAETFGKELFIVNAHQNTETGDLIGSQRPVRNRAAIEQHLRETITRALGVDKFPEVAEESVGVLLRAYDSSIGEGGAEVPEDVKEDIRIHRGKLSALFEWSDGSLVHAMKTGQLFLLDEISLADDSVLERLNSVLEPGRSLLLAEKGPTDSSVTAADGFQFLATMNPGGDYGKKELSPALRNRFTEIWVPALYEVEDVLEIVRAKLDDSAADYAESIVQFSHWFNEMYNNSATSAISIRDTLAWIGFINRYNAEDPTVAIMHGAAMVYIDTLGANPAAMLSITPSAVDTERGKCITELSRLLNTNLAALYTATPELSSKDSQLGVGPFFLPRSASAAEDSGFTFNAPTTRSNALRLFRALQLPKPILIEGNPGVGKTTLVTAISSVLGNILVRINLSEQTDLMDLFGSDVPVEGAGVGSFTWRDAPFLSAMKNGDWVLLDEMNLASQSVLEGLNAVLDHRGEVYVAELDQTFQQHPNFRLFAAQNPHHQGGGRKGLPASFVNRFTVVYADVFRPCDLLVICKQIFPDVADDQIETLTRFVMELDKSVIHGQRFGAQGSPWEFNLRDTLRWLQLLTSKDGLLPSGRPYDFCDSLFRQRFRNISDRVAVDSLYTSVFGNPPEDKSFYHNLSSDTYQVGLGLLSRKALTAATDATQLKPWTSHLPIIESLILCIQQNWPAILAGPPGAGKTTVLRHLAEVSGANLVTFPMNADIDAMDLVGGYEQADPNRKIFRALEEVVVFARESLVSALLSNQSQDDALALLTLASNALSLPQPSKNELIAIHAALAKVESLDDLSEALPNLLAKLKILVETPVQVQKAQFEWVDGLLIQCLEHGDWLVLDNANLCSSSVLDRLNSLLEPNGYLSVNEHPLESGEPRIVRPKEGFRIFLTLDARNGELSRAMRNRGVEVYFLGDELEQKEEEVWKGGFGLESAMYRFRNFLDVDITTVGVSDIAVDHISFQDGSLQARFQEQITQGLLGNGDSLSKDVQESLGSLSTLDDSWVSSTINLPTLALSNRNASQTHTIHPLNNEPLIRYGPKWILEATWLSEAYATLLDISKMEKAPVTHFDRSILQTSAKKGVRESTVHIAPFLKESLKGLKEYVGYLLNGNERSRFVFPALKIMRSFWWSLLNLVDSMNMEEAVFQIHLTLGRTELVQAQEAFPAAADFLTGQVQLLRTIMASSGLSTGKSMEVLWNLLRSPTVSKSLADRFDARIFPLKGSLEGLCKVRGTFSEVMRAATVEDVDIDELILELETAIMGMEAHEKIDNRLSSTPFFKAHFEAICQYFSLSSPIPDVMRRLIDQASLLAQRPTKRDAFAVWHESQLGSNQQILFSIDAYVGEAMDVDAPGAIEQNLQPSLTGKLAKTHTIALGQLDQFRVELEVMAQLMAVGANTVCGNQQQEIDRVLMLLMNELCEKSGSPLEDEYLQDLLKDGSHKAESRSLLATSQAWIQFALACIFAYVPDRPFDPALKHFTQRELLATKKSHARTTLDALSHFEQSFSGQSRNLRYTIMEAELNDMGADIPALEIPRPIPSQLSSLQGEFNIVLQIARNIQKDLLREDCAFDRSVGQNLTQMIGRLRERYRGYDDVIVPLVGFLQCLSVGWTLAQMVEAERDRSEDGDADALFQLNILQKSTSSSEDSSDHLEDSLYRLSQLATVRNVEISPRSRFRFVNEAHSIFAHLYSAWKGKISAEQEKFAKKSSLYAYRGGQDAEEEDDEEEFNSLFPDYENDGETTTTNGDGIKAPRDAAIRISTIHSHVFGGQSDPKALITDLLHQAGGRLRNQRTISEESSAATLPYLFFTLQDKMDTLNSGGAANTNYNIYTDPNVTEAKKLVTLVGKIQRHFRSLLSMEFEHSTVDDVIRIGYELLAFQHTEPVAKFMTKMEKLYEAMNEWERVASKALSAGTLYDDLTAMIVSWRRLELTTWMRLYDLEMVKCVEDAKSWWFVAYENIIAVPESLALAGQPLQLHAQELLKTLEAFFNNATMGQYQQRLQLVMQFVHHLKQITLQTSDLAVIYNALANFVAYYARFQHPVVDALAKYRTKLEKDVKEVVQLASWKDTNIASLRQSARTSHQKLFRLVRKFREELNRPVSSIIEQGPPDETNTGSQLDNDVFGPAVVVSEKQLLLDLCNEGFPDWNEIPTRFKNISATVSLMHRIGQGPNPPWDGTNHINDFLSDLQTSIAELQKASPTILNDEIKDTVKHLKTRKRTLFAYVLKQLRQMGFQYNLSQSVLSKQDSSATILAAMPSIESHDQFPAIAVAEYHFHKTLSLMGQVRGIQREHSGDLTPAEVARSTGFLEGILQKSLVQRRQLAGAVKDLDELSDVMRKITNLQPMVALESTMVKSKHAGVPFQSMRRTITWLTPITNVFLDAITAQCQLGKIEANAVLEGLRSWIEKIAALTRQFEDLPVLPDGIHSSRYEDLVVHCQDTLESLQLAVTEWTESFPMLAPVLNQLRIWTSVDAPYTNGHIETEKSTVIKLRDTIFASIDVVLASIQDLSKATDTLSTSADEVGWLAKEDSSRAIMLTTLRTKNVIAALVSASGLLNTLSSDQLQLGGALFAVILPILQQYQNLSRDHLSSYAKFHTSICKLSHHLSTSFIQIGTKGFCTPADKSTNNDGQEEKLEGGTGLGDGEGAEDISKDIGDDEDLTELAQESDTKGDKDEIEDEKDAVDMADAEMEGEMGEVPEKGEDEEKDGSGDENEGEEEMEEEAGGVEDFGPSTVDEKIKDKEDDQGQGTEQNEQAAAQDGKKDRDEKKKQDTAEQDAAEQDAGVEEGEEVGQDQPEKTDQHLEQGDTLDLPDDLDMDGNATEKSDDDSLGDLDDLEDGNESEGKQLDGEDAENGSEDGLDEHGDGIDDLEDDIDENADVGAEADETDKNDEADEETSEDKDKEGLLNAEDEKANAAEDAIPSDTQGLGLDQNNQENGPSDSNSAAQQEEGADGEEKDNNQGSEGEQGTNGQSDKQEAVGRNDELQDSSDSQPFKKLGDTLEKWHNQQRQIRQPTEKQDVPQRERKQDVDMADVDFEHLLHEESQAEAQALGAASEDQARALDDDQAIATNDTDMPQNTFAEDAETVADNDDDVEMENAEPSTDHNPQDKQDGQANTFIGEPKPQDQRGNQTNGQEAEIEQDVEEVDEQLSTIHLDPSNQEIGLTRNDARSLWQQHEMSTRTLAAALAEQLRLILAPTMATKLRGDFRTGKRLNIKRIIPYIASSYKRDKIWMRRGVPSKRSYQIMIALDDSKSMAEGESKDLAFETLALVSKALSMLESGELCVVGFGEDTTIAHPFDKPFTDDAGVEVLSQFTFEQEKTDVRKLVADGINLFQEARAKASGSASELWQLMLVVSDAICDDPDAIRRLVRKSQEEKIMIVFIVIDASARPEKGGKSIMDLEKVDITADANGEMKVLRQKYMADVFPFRWWIVVRDVAELPGVLATALRQWFAEVVESG